MSNISYLKHLESMFNVKIVKTKEQFDSHRTYYEIWKDGEVIIEAWTLKEAQFKLNHKIKKENKNGTC